MKLGEMHSIHNGRTIDTQNMTQVNNSTGFMRPLRLASPEEPEDEYEVQLDDGSWTYSPMLSYVAHARNTLGLDMNEKFVVNQVFGDDWAAYTVDLSIKRQVRNDTNRVRYIRCISAKEEVGIDFSNVDIGADDIPDDLKCPITQVMFRVPVMAEDGKVYEKSAIKRWLSTKQSSPLTNLPMQRGLLPIHQPTVQAIKDYLSA